jgi:cell division septation protein DedD
MTVETDQKQPSNADPVVINEKNKSQAKSLQGQDNQIRQVKKQELQQKPAETTQKEASKSKVGGQAWIIQVGSFQDKSKAYKERDRLRKSKLSAVFIERFENNRVPSYRVRMGPFLTLDKARVVNNKILAKYSIKGLVMSYEK